MHRCTPLPVTVLCPQPPGSERWAGRGGWDSERSARLREREGRGCLTSGIPVLVKLREFTKKHLGALGQNA